MCLYNHMYSSQNPASGKSENDCQAFIISSVLLYPDYKCDDSLG